MLAKFYVVEKDGVPAVWQTAPEKMTRLLKGKAGYTVSSESPSNTRAEALLKLRKLFPGSRPAKSN